MWASLDSDVSDKIENLLSVLSIMSGLERIDEWLGIFQPLLGQTHLTSLLGCHPCPCSLCGSTEASQHTTFSLHVTSSKHIAHRNRGVGPESPHQPMMIAVTLYVQKRKLAIWSFCISEPSHLDVDGGAGCMEVVDSEGFVFCGLLMPAGMVFPGSVRVLRLILGLVVGSCTCYLPLGLVPADKCDAF